MGQYGGGGLRAGRDWWHLDKAGAEAARDPQAGVSQGGGSTQVQGHQVKHSSHMPRLCLEGGLVVWLPCQATGKYES